MVTGQARWWSAVPGDWEDLAKIRARLDAGADPDGEPPPPGVLGGHLKPLHIAAKEGSPAVVTELAARVADIDAEHEGRTALWTAVYHGRMDNARALVAAGADPWRPMIAGWSPGRLSLAGLTPDLSTVPEGETGLSDAETALAAAAPRLVEIFDGRFYDGLGLACVAGISAAEAVRRLGAASVAPTDAERFHEFPRPEDGDDGINVVSATDVPGGCVITQRWGYAPQMPGVMALLSEGTFAYGLYVNPKSGMQGRIYRDGSCERWGLHPGGDPRHDATAREILAGYLAQGNAVAYCCIYAGLRLPDTRAVEGPPDQWLRLPERDWWN